MLKKSITALESWVVFYHKPEKQRIPGRYKVSGKRLTMKPNKAENYKSHAAKKELKVDELFKHQITISKKEREGAELGRCSGWCGPAVLGIPSTPTLLNSTFAPQVQR